MSHRLIFIMAGAALTVLAPSVHAEEVVINQNNKRFSEKKVTLKVGDTIRFVNADSTVHNVHSATRGHEFDLGAQQPGNDMTHTFSAQGKANVRCAIHPKMKMSVVVE